MSDYMRNQGLVDGITGCRNRQRDLEKEIERLRAALKIVAKSIYCCDGYRNVSISEEAEQAIINALKERD